MQKKKKKKVTHIYIVTNIYILTLTVEIYAHVQKGFNLDINNLHGNFDKTAIEEKWNIKIEKLTQNRKINVKWKN